MKRMRGVVEIERFRDGGVRVGGACEDASERAPRPAGTGPLCVCMILDVSKRWARIRQLPRRVSSTSILARARLPPPLAVRRQDEPKIFRNLVGDEFRG